MLIPWIFGNPYMDMLWILGPGMNQDVHLLETISYKTFLAGPQTTEVSLSSYSERFYRYGYQNKTFMLGKIAKVGAWNSAQGMVDAVITKRLSADVLFKQTCRDACRHSAADRRAKQTSRFKRNLENKRFCNCGIEYSEFARSPLSLPQTLFSHSLRSTICNPVHPLPMKTLRITNGGPERAKKTELRGERGKIEQAQNSELK